MDATEKFRFRQTTTSRVAGVAHFFGATSLVLLLVWLLSYRGGIDLFSDNAYRVFNVHPFLMFFGFIFVAGEAAMAYKTIGARKDVQKFFHMLLNLIALALGNVGIYAAFKFHNMLNIKHLYTFHSWIGMATFCFFALQWVFGFVLFMFPKGSPKNRARALPWHICVGRALLYMAICSAETGLLQKLSTQWQQEDSESRLINFTALAILLFGISVDLSISLSRYV
ncbi:Ascorbate ferrireductase (transmembrane) [Bertholletia excelsa]